jgi:hypothetical protein
MIVALSLFGALLASTAAPGETLTGKMAIYNALLGAPWSCSVGPVSYSAAYTVAPGNVLHGELTAKDGTEDTYFGYDAKRSVYWTANADSTGATESQTSADGVTFGGAFNDGTSTSNATNVFTIEGPSKWTVHAQGSAGGHPFDVTATCLR